MNPSCQQVWNKNKNTNTKKSKAGRQHLKGEFTSGGDDDGPAAI